MSRLAIALCCWAVFGCATAPTPAQMTQQARIDECSRAVGLVDGRITASSDGRWSGVVPSTHVTQFLECVERRGAKPWTDVMLGGG